MLKKQEASLRTVLGPSSTRDAGRPHVLELARGLG
jgi:hypothetical protein